MIVIWKSTSRIRLLQSDSERLERLGMRACGDPMRQRQEAGKSESRSFVKGQDLTLQTLHRSTESTTSPMPSRITGAGEKFTKSWAFPKLPFGFLSISWGSVEEVKLSKYKT